MQSHAESDAERDAERVYIGSVLLFRTLLSTNVLMLQGVLLKINN